MAGLVPGLVVYHVAHMRHLLHSALGPAIVLALLATAGCSDPSTFRYPGKQFFESEPKKSSSRSRPAPVTKEEEGEGAWVKSGVSEEQVLADSDSCFRFANAQVTKDIQIDRDINAARGDSKSMIQDSRSLDRRVDAYYYDNERVYRFESCMRSRGYSRN